MRRSFILIIVLFIVSLCGVEARACQCAGESKPCEEYWRVSAVFIGTVIEGRLVTVKEGDYEHQQRAVRISIDEAFRGVEGAEVEVLTGLGDSDCGFGFRRAQQYLIYAYRAENDQKLHTSICTRTRSLSEATADLLYIRGLAKAKRGATITGEVVRYLRGAEGGLANQPLAGVKVVFEGPQKYEAVTDANGKYRLEDAVAGEYIVKPIAPSGLSPRGPDRKTTVADKGCAEVSFWLESSARISGTVLNPQGLPVPKAEIFLIAADKEKYRGHWDAAYADENGKYDFKLIPPGSYVLTIRYDGMTSQTRPFPLMYYPGVAEKSQAKVFTIREGQLIEDFDLQMPPMPAEYEVHGSVVWSDGKPASAARVFYGMLNEGISHAVVIDDQGRFRFKAYEGLQLAIDASIEIEKGKYVRSNSIQLTVGADNQPIKLVLPAANNQR